VKIGVEAALADVSYDFGQSTVTKARVMALKSFACYFLQEITRPPDAKSAPDPRENEVAVFENFFAADLRIPPHPILLDILRKF
jgi:hypothetical protein